jgi:membrane-bound lytic murein transglycosylase B
MWLWCKLASVGFVAWLNHGARIMLRLFSLFVLVAIGLIAPAHGASGDPKFDQWIAELRVEAKSKGISDTILDQALNGVTPLKRVVELDRSQPEFKLTFDEYLRRIVSETRKRKAAEKLIEHDEILTEISKKYGVQKRYIVTFWGVETNFGQYLGSFNVPRALVTLAYDGRRSAYFRKELINALTILEQGHIKPEEMNGSWAGAMGQSQFMPSSFLNYAVDWDGDGRRDIWGTKADVFASTANYLSKAGWRDDITWGRKVILPKGFALNGKSAAAMVKSATYHKLNVWAKAGVKRDDGVDLPSRQLDARLVMPDGDKGPAFLVYSNFDSILRWNRSNYYALAIGKLSDTLRAK